MELLTQEQGAALKPGDVVDVHWFTPRKPKQPDVPSRMHEGREEWLELTWRNKVVASFPRGSASDGFVVSLMGMMGVYCVSRMTLKSSHSGEKV